MFPESGRTGKASKATAGGFLCAILLMSAADLRAGARVYSNIEYSHAGGYSLLMDGHVPASDRPVPVVILVHGGAWVSGDRKRSVEPLFKPLSDAGFAWFSISYRLASSSPTLAGSAALVTGAVDDVRAAVEFVRSHAAEYNIDPNRIALMGESAGAQLSAMAALRPARHAEVQAVVGFYCPSDLAALIQTMPMIPETIRRVVRATPFEDLLVSRLREVSPVNWVREDAPPFLLIHGTADTVVPFQQSVEMCSALRKAGSSCDLYPVVGGGHGLRWWEPAPRLLTYKYDMVRWLTQELSSPKPRLRK